jgi:hypothetical protein
MKIYRIAKQDKEYLTPEEGEEVKNKFNDIQCSFAKDKDGYYCYTHRARSDSYPSIDKIPKSAVDFINSTSAVKLNIYKIASTESDIKDVKSDVKDTKKDLKDLEKRVKDLEKDIGSLNIGHRQYYQDRTVFTSLQRKLERLERVEGEWKKYKSEMDDKVRKEVEKHTRATAGDISPKAP